MFVKPLINKGSVMVFVWANLSAILTSYNKTLK